MSEHVNFGVCVTKSQALVLLKDERNVMLVAYNPASFGRGDVYTDIVCASQELAAQVHSVFPAAVVRPEAVQAPLVCLRLMLPGQTVITDLMDDGRMPEDWQYYNYIAAAFGDNHSY